MNHTHPWGVPPKTERPVKLDKNGNLACSSCHLPHASDELKLQVKGGCAKCHPADKMFGAPPPPPAGG